MRAPVMIRDFLLDSDFHGVRFWFAPSLGQARRVLWVVMFLCSMAGLAYMLVHRVTYYYTYPTSTDVTIDSTHVPAPAIAMCPPNGKFSAMPPISTVRQLSDVHLALLLTEIKVNLLVEDDTQGKFVINKQLQAFATYLTELTADSGNTSISITTLQQASDAFAPLSRHFGTTDVFFIIERVKNIDMSLSLPQIQGAEYVEYVKQLGVRKDYVKTCMTYLNSTYTDCTDHLRQVVVDERACLVLDTVNGSALYFTDYTFALTLNVIIIQLLPGLMSGAVSFRFYERSEIPSHLYGIIQDTFFINQSATLSKVASHQYLSFPYKDKPCIETTKSVCIQQCLATKWECIPYYFVHVEVSNDIPGCKLFEEPKWGPEVRICSKQCASTCHDRQFFTGGGRLGGVYTAPLSNTFNFEPSLRLIHEMSVQLPLYLAGSLFAELGGTMGLFIGASVLTLYHCVEYSGVKIWRFIKKLCPV